MRYEVNAVMILLLKAACLWSCIFACDGDVPSDRTISFLKAFRSHLVQARPRLTTAAWGAPLFLFTDASFSPEEDAWPAGLGGVLVDSNGAQLAAFSYKLEKPAMVTDASFSPEEDAWPAGLGGVLVDANGAQLTDCLHVSMSVRMYVCNHDDGFILVSESECAPLDAPGTMDDGDVQSTPAGCEPHNADVDGNSSDSDSSSSDASSSDSSDVAVVQPRVKRFRAKIPADENWFVHAKSILVHRFNGDVHNDVKFLVCGKRLTTSYVPCSEATAWNALCKSCNRM